MNIKRGNIVLKLYPTPVKVNGTTYDNWTVAWQNEAGRQRKQFSKHSKAVDFANKTGDDLNKGFTRPLTNDQVASHNRAHDLLLPTGKPMELVASEYAETHKLTGGVPLRTLADFYVRHHTATAITPEALLAELLAAKQQDRLSPEYLHDLEVRIGAFAADFTLPISNITAPAIDDWLRGLDVGLRSRQNYHRAIRTLFLFAKSRRYLPKDWDEIPKFPRTGATDAPVTIYTPDELKKLLAAARWPVGLKYPMLPLLVFGAFAGIRTQEILRLKWEDVGKDYIEVQGKRTRSASRRLVPILPALKTWLAECSQESGSVCRYRSVENAMWKLGDRAGVPWRKNALRHSFISYRVAEIKNTAQVALECGNSAAMIFGHYRERVTDAQAKSWFVIRPKSVTKDLLNCIKPA